MAFAGLQNANDCRGLREEVSALFFFTVLHESLLATSLRHLFRIHRRTAPPAGASVMRVLQVQHRATRRRFAARPLFVHYEHASSLKSRFNEQVEFLEAFLIQLVEREGQPVCCRRGVSVAACA